MKLKGRYKVKKLRVIVCGSTFGQYYIRALQTVPDEFEVVGLLANGSNRSKLCADFYHVPLYTQIEDIPEVDIACVVIRSRAVGGSGTDIAEYFLNKRFMSFRSSLSIQKIWRYVIVLLKRTMFCSKWEIYILI